MDQHTANGNGHHSNGVHLLGAPRSDLDLRDPPGRERRRQGGRESVSVVIPAKNEARNIGWVLSRLPQWVSEVILVDGRSTDDTIKVAKGIRPDIVVVTENRKGKGAALRAGFRAATGDIVVMIDADRSMDPTEIGRYTGLLANGYDFVKGSRFMAGAESSDITLFRQLGNWWLRWLVNTLFGAKFSDLCYGYCAFRRRHLDDLALTADGFEIETQLVIHALNAGLRITEVPTFEQPRHFGVSNLRTIRDGQRVLRTLLAERLAPRPGLGHPDPAPAPKGANDVDGEFGLEAAM